MKKATRQKSKAREEVIRAATHQFAEHGYDGTTIQMIADELGVSKTAVLHHYSSKELLRKAVLDSMLEHWHARLPGLLIHATESNDRFDAVYDALADFFTLDPDRAKLAIREAFDNPHEVRRILRTTVRMWLDTIGAYVAYGKERAIHHEDVDPEAYVGLIMLLVMAAGSMDGVASSILGGDVADRLRREAKRIARVSLFAPKVDPVSKRRPR
jgi:AcrR family transcriptional regulator